MFSFKAPEGLVSMKGARGLVGDAYALRPGAFEIVPFIIAGYVPLKAGENTTISVPVDDLPGNADVKSITARLHVLEADDTGPAPPPNEATITRDNTATTFQVKPGIINRPRNVTIRLDRGEPIWTFADTLVKSSYDLPDFAAQLNAYLDTASVGGSHTTLNFLIKSDTPGSVRITILSKDVSRLQTQTWTNDLDQTVRIDRNLQLELGDLIELPLDPIGGGAPLKRVRLDVAGALGPERLLGPVRPHGGRDFATVSGDYAIGQQFVLDTSVEAVGLSAYLGVDADAEVYAEVQPDQNGVPGGDAPLAQSNVAITAAQDGAPAWVYAAFETPSTLSPGVPYWMVLKGVKGMARLGLESNEGTYLGPLMVNRTGRLWKRFGFGDHPSFGSRLRIVYVPEVDNQSAGVQVAVRGAVAEAVDPTPRPRTVALAAGGRVVAPAVLEIAAHARGTLTVANVIQEY